MNNQLDQKIQEENQIKFDSLPYEKRKEIIDRMSTELEKTKILIQQSIDENYRNNTT